MKATDPRHLKKEAVGKFKVYNKTVVPTVPFLRENTAINIIPHNFTLTQGGMGDYICWTIAMQWLAENAPWIHGRIFAPGYFIDFARYFFDNHSHWKVFHIDDFAKFAEPGTLIRGPNDQQPQLINAVGASLIDIGFAYFCNLCPAPAGIHYPELKVDPSQLPKQLRGLEKKYAVFTPGGTTLARLVRAGHINPLIAHAKAQGFTPVFLGKHQLADVHRSYFDDDIDYEGGIDLREKTSLLEAAAIMKYAAYTLGLDNGLLHLACCTDAPVIFGYNIAHPSQRRPIRRQGVMVEVDLTQKELACIHCQTNVKLLCYHNFKNCIYDDVKCIDVLFENDGARWKAAIERLLNETKTAELPPAHVEAPGVQISEPAA